ncbi:MAG: hypothetical protein IJH75_08950 [Mogibacterium sp.]|nr:hypothetical protein [Mogibacterium sp.]
MKKRFLLTALIVILAAFMLCACSGGGETSEEPEESGVPAVEDLVDAAKLNRTGKESKSGFDPATNLVTESEAFIVHVPSYCEETASEENFTRYSMETGRGVTLLQATFIDFNPEEIDPDQIRILTPSGFIRGMNLQNLEMDQAEDGSTSFSGTLTGGPDVQGQIDLVYNESKNQFCLLVIMQSEESEADYFADYYRILYSIELK